VLRGPQHLVRCALLDDAAFVHDQDAVGPVGGHPEVVGDHQDAGAQVTRHRLQVVEHLALDGHVERACRLVGDHQGGPGDQGDRDEDPLPHPAGQLVRVLAGPDRRLVKARRRQGLHREDGRVPAVGEPVQQQHLRDLPADADDRVERDRGILRDEPDPPAAHRPQGP
jgi:hypothetical protein